MLQVFLYGFMATSSLILGGLFVSWFKISKKALGLIMGFGAGALISAVSYELTYDSVKLGIGTWYPLLGFFIGAYVYYGSDYLLDKFMDARNRSKGTTNSFGLLIPMLLAIVLDGVPESIVLGLGMSEGEGLSWAMLAAIFISNLPESIAASTGMKESGTKASTIFLVWLGMAILFSLITIFGSTFFADTSKEHLSFIQAFAAGAILTMLANSMMPESFKEGGKQTGIATVTGFAISVMIIVLEMKSN